MAKKAVRYCSARSSRTGKPCRRPAIAGGSVCRSHGGAAPQVKRRAEERLADLIDPDRALREAARLAYFDIRKLFAPDGSLLSIHQWPDEVAAAVGGVEVLIKNAKAGDGVTDTVHKLKIVDKTPALTLIFKHLGLIVERSERGKPGEFTSLSVDEKLKRIEDLVTRVKAKKGATA